MFLAISLVRMRRNSVNSASGKLGPPKPESEDTEGETKFPLRRVGRECVRIEDAEQTVQEYILQM